MKKSRLYSIGHIVKLFGLSRSTLIYYEKIGLISITHRSASNYRLYSDEDIARIERILLYRSTGIPLELVGDIISEKGKAYPSKQLTTVLESRLAQTNREIVELRQQQQILVKLLDQQNVANKTTVMTKSIWVEMLRGAGLDEKGMQEWHRQFENSAPEAHQDFLESLGLKAKEIKKIRGHATSV